jgi:chromosome segregation ATPase
MSINLNHNCKMEFAEAKTKIVELRAELIQVDSELKEIGKIYMEYRKKVTSCENKKRELSKEIKKLEEIIESENMFETVENIEGFDTLLQEELVTISNGMDKTDYRKRGNYPRWYDLERLVKEVIAFKKLYPGWILESLTKSGQYDTLPPQTFYRYTYNSTHGHHMTHSGIEHLN